MLRAVAASIQWLVLLSLKARRHLATVHPGCYHLCLSIGVDSRATAVLFSAFANLDRQISLSSSSCKLFKFLTLVTPSCHHLLPWVSGFAWWPFRSWLPVPLRIRAEAVKTTGAAQSIEESDRYLHEVWLHCRSLSRVFVTVLYSPDLFGLSFWQGDNDISVCCCSALSCLLLKLS